jgi:hypothetical protein
MAACVLRCDGCGELFVAQRRHRRWCKEACRKATKRALDPTVTVPDYEPLILREVAAGRLLPEDGILWILDPAEMCDRYPHDDVVAA